LIILCIILDGDLRTEGFGFGMPSEFTALTNIKLTFHVNSRFFSFLLHVGSHFQVLFLSTGLGQELS